MKVVVEFTGHWSDEYVTVTDICCLRKDTVSDSVYVSGVT